MRVAIVDRRRMRVLPPESAGLMLGSVLLERADQQLQLLDPFGRPAKPGPPEQGELGFQLLDMQGLAVDLVIASGDLSL